MLAFLGVSELRKLTGGGRGESSSELGYVRKGGRCGYRIRGSSL